MTNYLSSADIRQHLNLAGNSSFDSELAVFAAASCDAVESRCGSVGQRIVTAELVDVPVHGLEFALGERPVISLTSVTSYPTGTTYTVGDFMLESATGVVRRSDAAKIVGPLLVTYVAGYAVVPEWANQAALAIIKALWRPQRGARQAPQEVIATSGVPAQADALMAGHELPGGFA